MKDNFKYIFWLIITFIASLLAIPCMIIGSITIYFAKQMFNLIEHLDYVQKINNKISS